MCHAVNPDAMVVAAHLYFDRFWARALDAFKKRVEEDEKEEE